MAIHSDSSSPPSAGFSPPVFRAEGEDEWFAELDSLKGRKRSSEDPLDRIVRCAGKFFDVPVCIVSLRGRDAQWFKAKVGIEIDTMPGDGSFCEAALAQSDFFLVEDTLLDRNFASHPLVTGEEGIRFYAGTPLEIEPDLKIGTLCVLDRKPRLFGQSEQEMLRNFGALVIEELRLQIREIHFEVELNKVREAEAAKLASQKERAEFLAMVAHEVRTPLNAFAGMVALMGSDALADDDGSAMSALQNSADHLVRIVNEVLDFAQLEETGFVFHDAPFDLHRELRCVFAVLRPQATAKGLQFDLDLDASVPQYVVGDRTRISQVLLNLLTNAIKFTPQGWVHVYATAHAVSATRVALTIAVRDTGIGMTSEATASVFKRYSQADPHVRKKYGGTGLGLVICRKLVEAMGGSITVDSVPKAGSVFTLRIPFEKATFQAPGATVRDDRDGHGINRAGLTILVVDDDAVSRKVTSALLLRLGYAVEAVATGREALAALRSRPFDIAFVDLGMPDLDGLSLARELHLQPEFGVPPPLIALTGRAKPSDEPQLDLFDDYLVKPASVTSLDEAIMSILSRRENVSTGASGLESLE
ncbi:ATP-binding response regulator [Paraburkholderia lycopersici]|uniref:Virulence sensor protein BvgS n=1 Tax=Paraburkholderia lycopersici TaxID=416944 RepID=A0A1G6HEM6_9BURK|nr:ATP-binding protein [Paraburkholderia lycopersici]SDB92712.1 Signal transduction histidine kinase [Paraburkholderia lycopersici]